MSLQTCMTFFHGTQNNIWRNVSVFVFVHTMEVKGNLFGCQHSSEYLPQESPAGLEQHESEQTMCGVNYPFNCVNVL